MKIRAFVVLLAFATVSAGAASRVADRNRPNVIVIFSDDHGWADLGANGVREDIKTPHLDALARDGVRFTRGYVTAPQCVPSRAGLLTGRYQQRCGVDDNLLGPLPKEERTIAHRMSEAGYRCGMVGKWHLEVKQQRMGPRAAGGAGRMNRRLPEHLPHHFGFQETFCGERNSFHATHLLDGTPVEDGPKPVVDPGFRVDVQTQAAVSFIERNAGRPFFLYLSYFAPHVPSEAPEKYLARFADVKDEKRRVALAMLSAIDDGVGEIRSRLARRGLDRNTLVFFIGDNGAPLKDNAWNGSLNEPLVGEKGMVTDGGVRVPFLCSWPGGLPRGKTYEQPVSTLDVLPTALAAAGVGPVTGGALDGTNLLPYLKGERKGDPHPQLYWRWRSQAAMLEGKWKLVHLAPDRWHLFDTTRPDGELGKHDLAAKQPEKVAELRRRLETWSATLKTAGLPKAAHPQDRRFFEEHVD